MKRLLFKDEIINTIKADKKFLKENFGVVNIGLFGSYAKDRQTEESDIDLLVEFIEPRFDWIASLQGYMEVKFNKKIEIVRKRNLTNSRFLQRVEQEVIYA
jgi:predicted nucleotidyltransferase